ncbi:hypothetical protein PR001_g16962 [Phytophthora rubi]|uniref:Ankyrin repeat protein n=2 Tax=Phytophthora TaxID=4783 RepID=A0A6A3K696_9STRA|nr:hypothetical protein PR002_g18241 [Phytophthora rubi]KAE9007475.1 hypothetical protein PR001_g16962 [Phytophthora rubi]
MKTLPTTLSARKRLKDARLPLTIRALPHVLKRIDLFAMSIEQAAVEAAASNDIERLEKLLAQMDIDDDRDDVGCKGTDIAAAKGYTEVVKTIYRWWVSGGYEPTEMCTRALAEAAAGGHDAVVRVLLTDWYDWELFDARVEDDDLPVEQVYDFDVLEALELAVKHNHHKTARVICETSKISGEMYKWAAEHDNLQVFDDVYDFHGDRDADNLYRAMLIAVSRGCVDIVKFVLDNCGAELLDYVDGADDFPCPLVTAIKHGQREVVDFLYAHDTGCEDESYVPALCTAAAYGPLDLVKMFYDNGEFNGSALEGAFASAAGKNQLEIMTYLQSKSEFDGEAIDKAFVEAARNGQLEAAKYLDTIEDHQVSAPSLDEAFEGAAGGCHLEMLGFLDGKGNFSRKVVTMAFENALNDIADLGVTGKDQVHVLKFLHGKGSVYPDVIDELFPYAGGHCSVAVVEFLYATGSISVHSVDEAFHKAAEGNCIEVVESLYKTGKVTQKSLDDAFLNAAERDDLYVMECLLSCRPNPRTLLDKALGKYTSARDLSDRVFHFLKQKQQILKK